MAAPVAQAPSAMGDDSAPSASVSSRAAQKYRKAKRGGRYERQQRMLRRARSKASNQFPVKCWCNSAAGSKILPCWDLLQWQRLLVRRKESGNLSGKGRQRRAAWPAQVRVLATSSQASAGAEEFSTSSWAAVAASPAYSHSICPRERVSLDKSVSARQSVSQSPGWWVSNPRPKTSKASQKKSG